MVAQTHGEALKWKESQIKANEEYTDDLGVNR